jgi:hypothetical protein
MSEARLLGTLASPSQRPVPGIRVTSEAAYALLARAFQAAALLGAGAAVLLRFSPEEQGYFFSFLGLAALQQASDFGGSYALLHHATHLATTGQRARLSGLLSRALRLNVVSALVFALLVGVAGASVFAASAAAPGGGGGVDWFQPWILLVCALFLTQLTAPCVAFIEGAVSARTAWRFRFHLELVTGPVLVGAMFMGLGLWALPVFWCLRFLLTAGWLASTWPRERDSTPFSLQDWVEQVWPFQWKIGLSVLSGFLTFQAITPIVMALEGPRVSGQFGFSLAAMNTLLMVTTAWPLSKASHYGSLLSRGSHGPLISVFRRVTASSTALSAGLALAVFVVLWWLDTQGLPVFERFADPLTTGLVLAAGVVHHLVHCVAVFLRADRTEPLLGLSLLGGLLTLATIWVVATYGDVREIGLAFLALSAVGLPFLLHLYRRRVAQLNPPARH